MKRGAILTLCGVVAAGLSARANEVPNQGAPPKVEQSKIDAAINKGVAYLKGVAKVDMGKRTHINRTMQEDELVLWTLVHAGVKESDPIFQTLMKAMLERKLEATYCVALQAMILEEVHRVKYQYRIKQCAQFLVDNQCQNGQWTYGEPTIYAEDTPSDAGRGEVSSGTEKRDRTKAREFYMPGEKPPKPEVKNRFAVKKQKDGGSGGDNSNTQYAALGMRACYDAGALIPAEVIEKAITWYRKSQKNTDGPKIRFDVKENLDGIPTGASGVMSVIEAEPQGWCYGNHDEHKAYGSMSAGSVGGLAIWLYIKDNDFGVKDASKMKRSWRRDKDVCEGLAWLGHHFSVTYNPGPYEHGDKAENSQHQYEYYLYALERAGMLYGTETMGAHWWYPEGAKVLIEKQAADGKWGGGVVDTCFAILFLKRATEPLTPSVSAR
jgi:hypothetical protein